MMCGNEKKTRGKMLVGWAGIGGRLERLRGEIAFLMPGGRGQDLTIDW